MVRALGAPMLLVPANLLGLPQPSLVEANAAGEPGVLESDQAIPAHLLDGGEIVLLKIKPSLWFILFASFRMLLGTGLIIVVSEPLSRLLWPVGLSQTILVKMAVTLACVRVGVATLQWVSRLYVLTNRRIMRIRGVFNVDLFECQLTRLQNTFARFAIYERIFGLGTIGFATAGTGGIEAAWENINHPLEVHERIRAAIRKAHGNGTGADV